MGHRVASGGYTVAKLSDREMRVISELVERHGLFKVRDAARELARERGRFSVEELRRKLEGRGGPASR